MLRCTDGSVQTQNMKYNHQNKSDLYLADSYWWLPCAVVIHHYSLHDTFDCHTHRPLPHQTSVFFPAWEKWNVCTLSQRLVIHCPQFHTMNICEMRFSFRLNLASATLKSLFTVNLSTAWLRQTSSLSGTKPQLVKWLQSTAQEKNGQADQLKMVTLQDLKCSSQSKS